MKAHSYFTFSLNNRLFGISTVYVEEIFPLPELAPILKASRDIIGTVNFRGDILPVMDLNLRLGYQSQDYRLTDSVVVLSWEELRVGIIVNEVYEVKSIFPEEITTESLEMTIQENKIIAGLAISAGNILILSNPGDWLRSGEIQQVLFVSNYLKKEIQDSLNANAPYNSSKLLLSQQSVFCPNATLGERAIFRERADHLKRSTNRDLKNLRPLTVFVLNDNFFGIDLKMVREFTDIGKVTAIPCVGAHIVGNMNLRGEILTLVDIRELLNLPLMLIPDGSKAIVVEVESIVAGVVVEEVCEVMFFLNPLEIMVDTPVDLINDQYLIGTFPYREKTMSILNLPKILLNGGLIVDEAN